MSSLGLFTRQLGFGTNRREVYFSRIAQYKHFLTLTKAGPLSAGLSNELGHSDRL